VYVELLGIGRMLAGFNLCGTIEGGMGKIEQFGRKRRLPVKGTRLETDQDPLQ